MLDARLRPGNVGTAEGARDVILDVVDRAQGGLCKVAMVRMDAGFPSAALLPGWKRAISTTSPASAPTPPSTGWPQRPHAEDEALVDGGGDADLRAELVAHPRLAFSICCPPEVSTADRPSSWLQCSHYMLRRWLCANRIFLAVNRDRSISMAFAGWAWLN